MYNYVPPEAKAHLVPPVIDYYHNTTTPLLEHRTRKRIEGGQGPDGWPIRFKTGPCQDHVSAEEFAEASRINSMIGPTLKYISRTLEKEAGRTDHLDHLDKLKSHQQYLSTCQGMFETGYGGKSVWGKAWKGKTKHKGWASEYLTGDQVRASVHLMTCIK